MNKYELIDAVAAKTQKLSKKDIGEVLTSITETIKETLVAGNTVTLVGFGTFKTTKRPARKGRNPKTGSEIILPACTSPKFVPGQPFKDAVTQE